MSALEQEILEKFHLLDSQSKQRLLRRLSEDTELVFDSNEEWLEAITRLNQEFQRSVGKLPEGTIQSMLDEIRDEM